ncbi:MAG: hypothetical protein CBC01_09450 [Betaproteobacteria bacterium TMED41]|nr:MAG: hypothetical protein CBC01_09450 [Betaproteobacteria bacterium TMED41]
MVKSSAGFTDTHDNQKDFDKKYMDKDPGPFIGVVKVTDDPLRMGRLGVNIPALTNTVNPKPSQVIWCQYLSPFYGAKSINATSKTDPYDYKETQHSYGMWAVPPDIDTEVLVIFAKGEHLQANAFWIGCVQQPLVNQQVPAHGAKEETVLASGGVDFSQNKEEIYGTSSLPAGEKNQLDYGGDVATIPNINTWKYPVNDILADQMKSQGLVRDSVRGPITSSARRESPSNVFGISTPGAIRSDSREVNIGLEKTPVKTDRNPGHSIVMDDGDEAGQSQLTRIRTAGGHQILMHDTEGTVYIANGSGKAFIEMEKDGTISVFSDAGINLRTNLDFNLHSERNINFHAAGSLNFTAENHVNLNAEGYIFAMGQKGILSSSQGGSVRTFGRDGISSFTDGTQLHGAAGRIDLAGSQVHMNSVGASGSWGPKWLKPDAVGIKVTDGLIDVDSSTPIRPPKAIGEDKFGKEIRERGPQTNKVQNRTTVSEFVTHEPYDRKSSNQRKKTLINEMVAQIKKDSPKLSATELKLIKNELLKQPSVKAVSEKLSKVVKLNKNINVTAKKLLDLKDKAKNIDNLIKNNIKNQVMSFVQGHVASAVSAVRSFFRF